MDTPSILLTRIDNRLIHGQVATQWNASIGASLIIVANDEVAQNTMRQNLMKMAAPSDTGLAFCSLADTAATCAAASDQTIFLVVETPQDVLALVKDGVPITKVNIGNMHMAEGKRQVATAVAVDDLDVIAFRELMDRGVELEIRRVPTTPAEPVARLFQ